MVEVVYTRLWNVFSQKRSSQSTEIFTSMIRWHWIWLIDWIWLWSKSEKNFIHLPNTAIPRAIWILRCWGSTIGRAKKIWLWQIEKNRICNHFRMMNANNLFHAHHLQNNCFGSFSIWMSIDKFLRYLIVLIRNGSFIDRRFVEMHWKSWINIRHKILSEIWIYFPFLFMNYICCCHSHFLRSIHSKLRIRKYWHVNCESGPYFDATFETQWICSKTKHVPRHFWRISQNFPIIL